MGTFELVVTIILLGFLYLATRGEKKALEDSLSLEREISKYNLLTEAEKLAQYQAWRGRLRELKAVVLAQRREEIHASIKRDETLLGKAENLLDYEKISGLAGPKVQRAIWEEGPNLKELKMLSSLLDRVDPPKGLPAEDLEDLEDL
jgi:hypothetical protein